jgi:two-component system, LytTR family, response regulator LytT
MKAIIIEDEKRTAQDLQQILGDLMPDIEILSIIDSVEESIDYLTEKGCPDLIFSDIQLADGLSFEIFQEVKITCPIIFCTAFDEYAIQAFNTNGIDYLLKPFDKKVIGRSLEKYNNLRGMFEKKSPACNPYRKPVFW